MFCFLVSITLSFSTVLLPYIWYHEIFVMILYLSNFIPAINQSFECLHFDGNCAAKCFFYSILN